MSLTNLILKCYLKKKIDLKMFKMLTSILSLDKRSLTASMFLFFNAKCNGD